MAPCFLVKSNLLWKVHVFYSGQLKYFSQGGGYIVLQWIVSKFHWIYTIPQCFLSVFLNSWQNWTGVQSESFQINAIIDLRWWSRRKLERMRTIHNTAATKTFAIKQEYLQQAFWNPLARPPLRCTGTTDHFKFSCFLQQSFWTFDPKLRFPKAYYSWLPVDGECWTGFYCWVCDSQ